MNVIMNMQGGPQQVANNDIHDYNDSNSWNNTCSINIHY